LVLLFDACHVDAAQRKFHPIHCGHTQHRSHVIAYSRRSTGREDRPVCMFDCVVQDNATVMQISTSASGEKWAGMQATGAGDAQFLSSCSGGVGDLHREMSTPSKDASFPFDLHWAALPPSSRRSPSAPPSLLGSRLHGTTSDRVTPVVSIPSSVLLLFASRPPSSL
jgi:hypothetical protein